MSENKIKKIWGNFMKKINKKVALLVVLVIVFIACLIGIMSMGIYKLGWDNGLTRVYTKVFPLPAAAVNGDTVAISDWQYELTMLSNANDSRIGQSGPDGNEYQPMTQQQLEKEITNKLVNQTLLNQIAKQIDVKVKDEDLDTFVDELVAQGGFTDKSEFIAQVKDFSGVEYDDFRERILYPELLATKVEEAYYKSDNYWSNLEERANFAKEEATKDPDNFLTIAQEQSDDQANVEIEAVIKGSDSLPAEISNVIFMLEEGQVSDVIKSDFGYYIIKLVKLSKTENDEDQAQVQNISIYGDQFGQYYQEYKNKAKIKLYVNGDVQ